ncbi:MAG: Clp protease ClpP [Rikenellaceae bacterium]
MENIKIKNSLDTAIIDIEGMIGVPEEWQFDSPDQRVATYDKFKAKLSQIEALDSKSIVVNIRSTGGDVNDAMLIYDALVSLDASITTRCYGYTASAATVIAQAATQGQREISANALYLIHRSTCVAEGNAEDLAQRILLLEKSDERLAELCARRSGRDVEEFTALMGEESGNGRWLSPDEAIECGLSDVIIDIAQVPASSMVNNLWQKIRRSFGITPTPQPIHVGASILHPNSDSTLATNSLIEFQERQQEFTSTQLVEVEDPSTHEVAIGHNSKAYEHDAKALRRV